MEKNKYETNLTKIKELSFGLKAEQDKKRDGGFKKMLENMSAKDLLEFEKDMRRG